uniref:Uncharacterized protein n=1 Tax=Panagrolaimus superbus TaxID=310955 RepID=A0A914YEA2_9BILA
MYNFVCAQPLSKALRFRRELDEDHCACANFVPETCKISQISSANKKDPNNRIFKICYLSTLRTPPKVYGLNQEKDFIVTIDQFWLEPYWKDFELSNLTLFYKFEVKSPEHCDEIGKVTTINDSSTPLHICTSSLPIEMNGENIPSDTSGTGKKSYDPTDNDDQYDEDENAAPEVEFGRNVFVGAKFVDIWYTVTVKRPHQLSFGERPFHDVTTVISSESLKHNLEPEVFGNGVDNDVSEDEEDDDKKVPMSKETKAGHESVSKVSIQSEKDDDDEDDEEDAKDPIPSDNPGITDESEEDGVEGESEDKNDETDKEEDEDVDADADADEDETEEVEDSAATEEPEEADKDEEVDDKDKSEQETVDSEEEETTTMAEEDATSTGAPSDEIQEADDVTSILDDDDMASGNEVSHL